MKPNQCRRRHGKKECRDINGNWVEEAGKEVNLKSSKPIKISNTIKKSHGKRC
jgi:hypothetical protein